ncbi:unnamed protein product [Rotaria socialis]
MIVMADDNIQWLALFAYYSWLALNLEELSASATISVIPEPTSQSDYTTAPVVSLDSKTTVGVEITTIGSAVSLGQTSMIDRQPVTTQWFCDEKEFITYLIATKSVRTAPMDISNTDDFISKGVDFTNEQSKIIIDIPQDGAIVRDVKLFSTNAAQIEVSFQRKSGIQTGLVRGAPTALHTDEFPVEKVNKIAITVIKTNDDYAAGGVTLSIVVCDETTAATKLQSHTTLVSIPKTVPPTTVTKCAEMELIGILISTNAIIVTPEDISNKEDLIRNSVTFTQHKPIFVIELPNAGMIIRDLRLDSINVHQINAIFIGQSGEQLVELKSNPNNLQKDQLPTEKVKQIILTLAETKGEKPPAGVTLSIIACDGGHATVKVKPGTQGTMTTRPSTTESTSSESTEETPLVRETTPASAETTVTRETKPQTTQRAFTRETIPATKETTVARETKPASEDPTSVHQTKAATTRTTTEREVKTTHADVKTTHDEVNTTEESTQGTTRKVVKTTGETAGTVLTTGATTSQPAETTTRFHCKHMEYIDQLIASNSVTIAAENKAKKEDLIKLGVDFVELSPVIVIDIPKNGAIVRDVKVTSRNVAAIVVILTTVEGKTLSPIRGHPTSLPNHEFPAELVTKIVIQIVETTDNHSPKQVTLSVVACAPRVTVGTTEGTTTQGADKTTHGEHKTTSEVAGSVSTTKGTTTRGEPKTTSKVAGSVSTTKGTTTRGEPKTTSKVAGSVSTTKGTTTRGEPKTTSEVAGSVSTTKGTTTRGEPKTTHGEVKTTHGDVKTTHGEVKTTEESTQGTTRKVVKTTGETAGTVLTTGATTSQPAETTTRFHCKHMEYIDQLIASNSVTIAAENKAKKEDLIKLGVDFVELSPVIVIDIPKNGAIVRDVKVTSRNVAAIVVILTTVEGKTLSPIRGHPTSLPNHEFPAELVTKIVIQIVETTDKHSPKQVTLSVVACAPRVTVGTTEVHKPSQTTTHKPITLTEEKCTNMQDVVQLGSKVFASVNINGMPVKTASIPIWLAVTNLPFVIKATFKHPATLREVSIVNPSESEVFLMKVATDQTSDVFSMNRDAPTVTFENDLEFVGELTITLLSTRDNMLPENPVKLAILACYTDETFRTKAVVESTPATTNVSSSLLSTYPSTNPSKHKTIPDVLTTTSDTCEDGIALIPYQSNNENKPLMPRYFIQPRTPYQPSNINPGEIGVSFPASDKPYIIIFPMAPIAIIKSVRLPNTTNVDQIRVMFLDAKDKPIMTHPLDQVPLQITSQVTTSPKINVYLSTKVNSVHITLLHTSDNQPPHDVTVEIVVCVAPTITTPTTSVTEVETHTVPTTDHVSSQPLPDSPCKPKTKYSARITVGACISQQEIQHESCVGYCPSYEQLDPLTGNVAAKECSCCAPDSTYTESIMMDCRNTTTGRNEQRTTQIIRIRSCKCLICLGTAKRSYSDDKGTHETMAKTNPTAIKTRTRRR